MVKTLKKSYQNDSIIDIFDRCFYFFCAEEQQGELVIRNTRSKNDKYYSLENMEMIYEAIKSCI